MDEITRYSDLANAATTGHWPAHLLAPFDDKVQVLGDALTKTIDQIWHLESEVDGKITLEEENEMLKSEIDRLRGKIDKIKELVGA